MWRRPKPSPPKPEEVKEGGEAEKKEVKPVEEAKLAVLRPTAPFSPWVTRDEFSKLVEEVRSVKESLNKLSGELSRFSEEFQSTSKSINEELGRVRVELGKVSNESNRALRLAESSELILKLIGSWKGDTCTNAKEGICTAWQVNSSIADTLKQKFGENAVKQVNGDLRVNIKVVSLMCATCPLYTPPSATSKQE